MRRTASEVIRSLEMRVARLEREASPVNWTRVMLKPVPNDPKMKQDIVIAMHEAAKMIQKAGYSEYADKDAWEWNGMGFAFLAYPGDTRAFRRHFLSLERSGKNIIETKNGHWTITV